MSLDDRAALARFLDAAATSAKARPDVRGRAAWLRSLLFDRAGQASEASKARAELGLLTSWWVAGPFDNEGRTGHATVYAPEKTLVGPIDPNAHFDGKERAVGWRLMPAIAAQGMVSLDAMLRPDTNVTAYLTTMVLRAEGDARGGARGLGGRDQGVGRRRRWCSRATSIGRCASIRTRRRWSCAPAGIA